MSDFEDQNKEKEVELLKNSINQLKSVHQKLEATAKAAKERREKAQQSVAMSTVATTAPVIASPVATDKVKQETVAAKVSASPVAASTHLSNEHIDLETVVDSLKLSSGEMPKEEFHGLHSK